MTQRNMTRSVAFASPILVLAAGFVPLASIGCGPTNTSRTEYHEHIDTSSTGGAPSAGNSQDPQQQNSAPPPVIEEKRSAPETVIQ